MSTTRISGTDSGMSDTLVRTRSSSITAVHRGRNDTSIGRSAASCSGVHQLLDPGPETLGQRVELEVHVLLLSGSDVPAGDGRADLFQITSCTARAARGVCAHQPMASVEVDGAGDLVTDGGQRRTLDPVPHLMPSLWAPLDHGEAASVPVSCG